MTRKAKTKKKKKTAKKKVTKKKSSGYQKKSDAYEAIVKKTGNCFVRAGQSKRWIYPTDEAIEKTCTYLRIGAYLESAITMAGIPKKEFYKWMHVANDDTKKHKYKKQFIKYRDSVDKAVEECSMKDLNCIENTVTGKKAQFLKDKDGKIILDKMGKPIVEFPYIIPNWKAAAWRLSRRKPKEWGEQRSETVEHNHSVNPTSNTLEIKFVNPINPTKNNIVSTPKREEDG